MSGINKKYSKKNVLNWKNISTAIIFSTLFVSGFPAYSINPDSKNTVSSAAASEKGGIEDFRKQFADVLLKAEKQEKDITRIKITAAAMLGDNYYSGCDEKMFDAIKDLELNTREGKYLVKRVFESCNYLDNEIAKLEIPNDAKVKLQCRVDELRSSAENYGITINRPLTGIIKKTVDVIDVNNQLQVVILGAGLLDGIKTGLLLTIQAEDAKVRLTVVSVREYISAAIITSGDSDKVKTGMKATID